MLTLKDGDLLIDYGSNQCQVYMEDEFVPFFEPQHSGFSISKIKLKTVKQYLIYPICCQGWWITLMEDLF